MNKKSIVRLPGPRQVELLRSLRYLLFRASLNRAGHAYLNVSLTRASLKSMTHL
jgi:hypothetical protein